MSNSKNASGAAGVRHWGVCLAVSSAFLGIAGLSGELAKAALPVATLAAGSPAQAGYGTIKGRLVWGGAGVPQLKVLQEVGKSTKDPEVCAKDKAILSREMVVDPKTKGIQYGFAYLEKPSGTNPEAVAGLVKKAVKVVIDQENCEFIPYSTAVHEDQILEFKSSDPVNHNVHTSSFTNTGINQMLPPGGALDKKFVAERRPIELRCDIHPWMQGWIMVFGHPFFAVTGVDGSFEIQGVPAGTQNFVLRLGKSGFVPGFEKGIPVKVGAGQVTDLGNIKFVPKSAAVQ